MKSLSILKSEYYKKTVWKNGLGTTLEIDLLKDPTGKRPFQFRLSEAQLTADNAFSEYLGYHRLLTITEGNGIYLNERPLFPMTVHSFSGEEKIQSRLIDGPCKDLGVIFDPERISAAIDVFNQVAVFPQLKLKFDSDLNYLFLVNGKIKIGEWTLNPRDTLKIDQPQKLIFSTLVTSTYLVIRISKGKMVY